MLAATATIFHWTLGQWPQLERRAIASSAIDSTYVCSAPVLHKERGMEAFSLAVRRRIIELFQRGLEGDDVAEIMACSPAAARRIWQRYREEGLVGPRPHAGGHTPKLTDE